MKINQKVLSVFAFTLVLTLNACNKDDDDANGSLTKTEAQSKLSGFNTSAKSDLQHLSNTEGLEAVKDFFSLVDQDDPFGRIAGDKKKLKAFLKEKGNNFRNIFAPASIRQGRVNGETSFDFDANTGTYEWNSETQEFEKTAESAIIKIKFPIEGSPINNAELQLTAYAEELVIDGETGEDSYEPTLIKASILVDSNQKAALDLNIDYDNSGFPLEAEISLGVSPYTVSLAFNNNASTSSTISLSLLKGQQTLVATSITVKYTDSSKSEESLTLIEGYIQLKELKVQGNINFEGTENAESLNDYVKLEIYSENQKIGDVVFVTENEQDVPYLQYADGTKEKMETVFQPVVDELEALSEDLDSNG
jgi:hypothetical protein